MTLSVSHPVTHTEGFTFLSNIQSEPGHWRKLINKAPSQPVVLSIKGTHPGLLCLVMHRHPDTDTTLQLAETLIRGYRQLCTETRIVVLPASDTVDDAECRARFQTLVDWQPDAVIAITTACCPKPLTFSYRRQAGSAALGSVFSAYTVHGNFAPLALTRYPWPCPSVELLLPESATGDTLQQVCQTLSELKFEANRETGRECWLGSAYRLDALKAASVTFSDRPVFGVNITLNLPTAKDAFVTLHPGESIGWLDHNGLDHLRLKGASTHQSLFDYFDASDNRLRVRVPLICFLIANSVDCLRGQGILHFCPVKC